MLQLFKQDINPQWGGNSDSRYISTTLEVLIFITQVLQVTVDFLAVF